MVEPLIPVILSGGAGTRLWPLSREMFPQCRLAEIGGGRDRFLQVVSVGEIKLLNVFGFMCFNGRWRA